MDLGCRMGYREWWTSGRGGSKHGHPRCGSMGNRPIWPAVSRGPIEILVTDTARYLSNDVAIIDLLRLRRTMAGFQGQRPPFH